MYAIRSYYAVFGIFAGLVLFLGADFIGTTLLGDERTVKSLPILAISLPFYSRITSYNVCYTKLLRGFINISGESLLLIYFISFLARFLFGRNNFV